MPCTDEDYAELRDGEARRSGESLFETRLAAGCRLALAASLEGLVSVLREAQPEHLQRAIMEAQAINETSFFRDGAPFDALRTEVLPRLIAARRGERRLRVWSAACSTGQEAYSVAMLAVEHFPELAEWNVTVLGTDLSGRAVEYARRGIYRKCEVNQGLSARLLVRHFDDEQDGWRVNAQLRGMCRFEVVNLSAVPEEFAEFDLMLVRNVLLYLHPEERGKVLAAVHRSMARDGFLLLGDAEQAEDSTDEFTAELVGETYFYRKTRRG